MKNLIVVLLFIVFAFPPASGMLDSENSELADTLRFYVGNIRHARNERHKLINERKSEYRRMPRSEARIRLAERIGDDYLVDELDSALLYLQLGFDEAKHLSNNRLKDHLRLKLVSLLPSVGIEIESKEILETYDPKELSRDLRYDYWLTACQMYHTIGETYPAGRFKERYGALTREAIDSLRTYYPTDSPVSTYLLGYKYLLENESDLATANFVDAVPQLGGKPELLDFAYSKLARHYKKDPNKRQRYLYYLLKRAINTLDRGLIRAQTLAEVGEELIKEGETELGTRCIELALQYKNNSYQRPVVSFDRTKYLPYVTAGKQRWNLIVYVIGAVSILLAAVFAIFFIRERRSLRRRDKEVDSMQHQLDTVVDETIRVNRNLTDLTFLSMEQLRDFGVHVYRKLKAGQIKDLYEEVDSGKYQNRLQEKFFEVFDSGFLTGFPDFVDKLNELFIPGRELKLLPDARLTPELRIAAFLRLGVNDTAQLSRALNLSLNTIYTYRNRLRGRAADRENFEKNLLKIV